MSQSTLDKIKNLFSKKKEELKGQENISQLQSQAVAQANSQKPKLAEQDVQMSILNDFKDFHDASKKDKLTKKIKKKKEVSHSSKQQQQASQEPHVPAKDLKNPVTIRQIAGVIWEDPTMADWSNDDYRLFVGNLGNEVTDTVLSNAFRKYNSFQRARVVRDKRSLKTKGYGFVSLGNADDYLKCYREMNGAYVGNRPCKIEPGKWKDRMHEYKKDEELSAKFKKPNLNKKKYKVYGRY